MAGHNKWSKVKNRKGAVDAKRSKIWTKIIREITVAARMGSDDPAANPRLRKALDDARAANMPKDTVQRAVSRGSSSGEGDNFEELTYEAYGPSGVAILIDCMTDNRNRTSGEVRAVLSRNGGNLGTAGSVSFGFKKKGQLVFDKTPEEGLVPTEDKLLEIGLEHNIEDVVDDGDSFVVTCPSEDFLALREAFQANQFSAVSAEVAMIPDVQVHVSGDDAVKVLKLIDVLEDLDDVQHVWTNVDIDADEMERLLG